MTKAAHVKVWLKSCGAGDDAHGWPLSSREPRIRRDPATDRVHRSRAAQRPGTLRVLAVLVQRRVDCHDHHL